MQGKDPQLEGKRFLVTGAHAASAGPSAGCSATQAPVC